MYFAFARTTARRIAAIAACAALAACQQPAGDKSGGGEGETSGSPRGSSGDQITIAIMPKQVGIEYFNAVEKGAREAADEMNVKLIYDGPVTNDVTKQAEMLDSWITRKVDVIAVSPNDPHALANTLQKAMKQGIKVLTYDSDSDEDSREYFVNQATFEAIGTALVDVMAEEIGGTGEVAIVSGSLTAANQNAWMEVMRKHIAGKYPNMKIVDVKPSEEDQQLAFQVTQDLLKAHPNLRGIFGITSVALPGAAQAVEQSGYKGKVAVTGLSTPNSMKQYVKNDVVKTFILWSPVDLGYLTVAVGKELKEKGKLGEKISAGRLGDKEVSGTQVLLGPAMRFNKDNIDEFDF